MMDIKHILEKLSEIDTKHTLLESAPTSVTLKPVDSKFAQQQTERYRDLKDQGIVESDGKRVNYVEAEDYEEESED